MPIVGPLASASSAGSGSEELAEDARSRHSRFRTPGARGPADAGPPRCTTTYVIASSGGPSSRLRLKSWLGWRGDGRRREDHGPGNVARAAPSPA